MIPVFMIFLILLGPVSAFAAAQQPQSQSPGASSSSSGSAQTLEGCFTVPDPGSRSGCLMEVAANEKDVVLCDLIEIPGMVHECIDGVAKVTPITQDRCKIMNEKFRDHCFAAIS